MNAAATTIVAAIHEDILARQETSDFQILAHFTKFSQAGVPAHFGGCKAKFVAEDVSEVAVAGEPKFQGKPSQIVCSVGQPFERGAQPQLGEVAMYGQSSMTMKETREMKRRHMNGTSHVVERDPFTQSAGEVGLGGLGTFSRDRRQCCFGGACATGCVAQTLTRECLPRVEATSHQPKGVRADTRFRRPAAA